jgi:hypothetical protein
MNNTSQNTPKPTSNGRKQLSKTEQKPAKMPHEIISFERIEREAKAAAKLYSDINYACNYPFGSEAGDAFKKYFVAARAEIDAQTSPPTAAEPPKPPKAMRCTLPKLPAVIVERQNQLTALLATLGQAPGKTPPITIHPASTTTGYDGAELSTPAVRAHADTPQGIPSRMGNQLRYRCGRITDLHGNLITTGA